MILQLRVINGDVYDTPELMETRPASRDEFVQMADILRIQKLLEKETIRLHSNDGLSSLKWIEALKKDGSILAFKSSSDPPPEGSGLAPDVFVLCIQTTYQKQLFSRLGHHFSAIDATHNTTHYENTSLFTVLNRDKWGHGKCR